MEAPPIPPPPDAAPPEPPAVDWRATRHRLNGAERWFTAVRDRLDPYHAMLFGELLALAYKPEHADYLADYARDLLPGDEHA